MAYLVIQKTAAEFTADNPVLRPNQIGSETDTELQKLGDGLTEWNLLSYYNSYYTPATGTDIYVASFKMNHVVDYFTGLKLEVKFENANTGASTINLNALGAKAIIKDMVALVASDILAGGIYTLTYDGTSFQIN